MKLSLHPLVLRGPFAFTFGFLMALCLGLSGCDSSPPASGYTLVPTAKPDAGRTLHQTLDSATPSASLRQFSSKGHVLGFDVGSVLFASGTHSLKVEFVNANPIAPQSDPSGGDGKDNKTPALSEVRYPGLWQGIDLSYQAEPDGIAETVWKVEPGADISQARLRYNRPLTLNQDGSLNIRYPIGNLTESAPIAWQEKNGQRQPVAVAFALNSEQELGFKLGDHDPALPVWIDPTLSWNTFLGGAWSDDGYAIAADGSGNVYVAGRSSHSWGRPQRAFDGGISDAFVAKLDSTGQLIWNTFLGGAYGKAAIAVDGSGNVYVAGTSQASWGSPQRAYGGDTDAFVAKLNSFGQLVWNTFLGGAGGDIGNGIAVDGNGNAYVVGYSNTTWGNPQRAAYGGGVYTDTFVAKLDSFGSIVWNTFLGGAGGDDGYAIAVDGSGNAYVTGDSTDTWGNPQREFISLNGNEAFAAKLDSTGVLLWNTFFGGEMYDAGSAIAVDGSGNAYVAGRSEATWGSPQRAFGGVFHDAFVAKLDNLGQNVWNTFLGGMDDAVYAIVVDGSGNAYVVGSSSFATWGNPQRAYLFIDAFAAQVDSSGQLIWNTFLGSGDVDSGSGIAVDGSGNVYVVGSSQASWGSPLRAFSNGDAFVAKLTSDINCLFNWAEQKYAGLFTPSGTATAVSGDTTYRYYSNTNASLRVSSSNQHVSYQLADGTSQDVGPLNDWVQVAGCTIPPPPTECLFNWAEKNYPGLFAPSGFATAVWDVYTYRYYSATKAYLGVSSVDKHVYYLGQNGKMQDEGPTSYWFPLAGCQ